MKEEYTLYLDESRILSSGIFAMAGIIIRKNDAAWLGAQVREIKRLIWEDEYIRKKNPSLHCTEINNVYARRKKESKVLSKHYEELGKKPAREMEEIYQQIYEKLSAVLADEKVSTLSCIIHEKKLKELFYLDALNNGNYLIDDSYHIALQKVIESYTHFLCKVDGVGDIVYESRNTKGENSYKSPDIRMIHNFHQINANNRGIAYTNDEIIQERNRNIKLMGKELASAGLQVADFVAYHAAKRAGLKSEAQRTRFMEQIYEAAYNGGHTLAETDNRAFWGMMVLPPLVGVDGVSAANKTLKEEKEALKEESVSLKREITKLQQEHNRIIKQMQKDSNKLQQESDRAIKRLNQENNKFRQETAQQLKQLKKENNVLKQESNRIQNQLKKEKNKLQQENDQLRKKVKLLELEPPKGKKKGGTA